jgi:predicted flap endonuclease-1-like 5' DNA nuclease
MRIEEVEGIGPAHGQKLAEAGVATTEALLERGASEAGRSALAEATGVSGTLILEWVNHVDLMRLDGVGSEYSDLLEAAGVDSPAELAQRNAANLATTFQEVVAARPGIVRRIPTEAEVAGWIAQAGTLPKVVTHGGSSSDAGSAASPADVAPSAGAPAAEPEATSAPTPSPASTARALAGEARASSEGLWARIKRFFGG